MKAKGVFIGALMMLAVSAGAQEKSNYLVRTGPPSPAGTQIFMELEHFLTAIRKTSARSIFNDELKNIQVTPVQIKNAMNSGDVIMAWGTTPYIDIKDPIHTILTFAPFSTTEQYLKWRKNAEVKKIIDQLHASEGIKIIHCGTVSGQMDFLSRHAIANAEDDLKGQKISMPASGVGELYQELSIVTMQLPFSELPTLATKGLIDGAYTYTPHDAIAFKFHSSFKSLIYPSKIRPLYIINAIFKLSKWNEFTNSQRIDIEKTCLQISESSALRSAQLNKEAIEKFSRISYQILPMSDGFNNLAQAKWKKTMHTNAVMDQNFQRLAELLYGKNWITQTP